MIKKAELSFNPEQSGLVSLNFESVSFWLNQLNELFNAFFLIDVKSKDEIGLLAQAIGRMQTSLRLAMNRLRRKR